MIYLHFCNACNRIHILSGHKSQCPACDSTLVELSVPYEKYVSFSIDERNNLLQNCQDSSYLHSITSVYPMRKYHKKTPSSS